MGFEQPDFDDSHFAVGDAAFGTGSFCPLDATVQTPWPLETDLLLRKTFTVPANATTMRVAVTIDNDMQVFINGVDISGGLQQNEGGDSRHAAALTRMPGVASVRLPPSSWIRPCIPLESDWAHRIAGHRSSPS